MGCGMSDERRSSVYTLVLLMLVMLMASVDDNSMSVLSGEVAQDVHFGVRACLHNNTIVHTSDDVCLNFTTKHACLQSSLCAWTYTGKGDTESSLVAGPWYTLMKTCTAIGFSFAGQRYSRKIVLTLALAAWSILSFAVGNCQLYWQLAVMRTLAGTATAMCVPFATAILCDLFEPELRAGILGFFVTPGLIGSLAAFEFCRMVALQGSTWRTVYFFTIIPSFAFTMLMGLTVNEPQRGAKDIVKGTIMQPNMQRPLKQTLWFMFLPSVVLAGAGACMSAMSAVVTGDNVKVLLGKETDVEDWVPLALLCVGGVCGGCVADLSWRRRGVQGRLVVSAAAATMAIAASVLVVESHGTAAWFGIALQMLLTGTSSTATVAAILELVPADVRTMVMAVMYALTANLCENSENLLKAFQRHGSLSFHTSLACTLPSLHAGGVLLTVVALWFVRRTDGRLSLPAAQPLLANGPSQRDSRADQDSVSNA